MINPAQGSDLVSAALPLAANALELPNYNGSNYKLTAAAQTWEQAETEAIAQGGHLVTINDQAEQNWLRQTFGQEQLWIGINDRAVEGQFVWASGENSAFRDWAPGEPNSFGGKQDYGVLNFNATGQWDDESATRQFRGMIEIPIPQGPPVAAPPPNTTYLSDLTPTAVNNGYGPIEKDRTNGGLGLGDGGPLNLAGVIYSKGVGAHANSEITYALNGQYKSFLADVGLDDSQYERGSVVFQVFVDGVKQFDSGLITGYSPTQKINLDVAGKQTLKLVATDGGDNNYNDHANWADARLTANGPVTPPPVLPLGQGFSTELVAEGFSQPTAFAYAPDGRIFVAEKAGRLKVIDNGLTSTVLDINQEVNGVGDRGLIGLVLDPNFAQNGRIFLSYSVEVEPGTPDRDNFNSPASGRLISIQIDRAGRNVVDLSTRKVLFEGLDHTIASHSVGDIDFDNQGNLLFTWGDGGFDRDRNRLKAQDPNANEGKLFRINPDTGFGVAQNGLYDANNPNSTRSKVMALGIRNSFRFSVDRPTGDIYLGEVSDGGPEEVNVIRGNQTGVVNLGWPYYQDNVPLTPDTTYGTPPAGFTYQRAFTTIPRPSRPDDYQAISGGQVYRGDRYPDAYKGRYFFGDFGQNQLYTAAADGSALNFKDKGNFSQPVDIHLGPDGYLYILSLIGGRLERLVYKDGNTTTNVAPITVANPNVTAGVGSLTVNFSSTGSRDPEGQALTYGWDFDGNGAIDSTAANPSFTYTSPGKAFGALTTTDPQGASTKAPFEITLLAANPNDGNVAFGKATVQSSTDFGGLASRAVDGNANPLYGGLSITHTAFQRAPYWEVDLGAVYDLSQISLFNRSENLDRLTNYWVLASENAFNTGNLTAALSTLKTWKFQDTGTAPLQKDIAVNNQRGRYVRVQLAGDGILSLAEVKVQGRPVA
jgi:glucose/arabinose dehydrogenase